MSTRRTQRTGIPFGFNGPVGAGVSFLWEWSALVPRRRTRDHHGKNRKKRRRPGFGRAYPSGLRSWACDRRQEEPRSFSSFRCFRGERDSKPVGENPKHERLNQWGRTSRIQIALWSLMVEGTRTVPAPAESGIATPRRKKWSRRPARLLFGIVSVGQR
jgi:hypothetical protein